MGKAVIIVIGIAAAVAIAALAAFSTYSESGADLCEFCPTTTISRAYEAGDRGLSTDIAGVTIVQAIVQVPSEGEAAEEAAALINDLCPLGTVARYDVDDTQDEIDGLIIAEVFCPGESGKYESLNARMIETGAGSIWEMFCPVSEFRESEWARDGCPAG